MSKLVRLRFNRVQLNGQLLKLLDCPLASRRRRFTLPSEWPV